MTHSARKMIALSTALSMLALLAWPSYAICGCDEPSGMPCCDPESAPAAPVVVKLEAETASCCSAEAEPEPAPAPDTCSMESMTEGLAFVPTGCEQDVVSADLPTAGLPSKTTSSQADGSVVVTAIATVPATVTATDATHTRNHRAPPPRPVAAFILNATLLI